LYGRDWKLVSNLIPTRSSAQIRSHAQKYFAKLSSDETSLSELQAISEAEEGSDFWKEVERMVEDPEEVERRVSEVMSKLVRRSAELKEKLSSPPSPILQESETTTTTTSEGRKRKFQPEKQVAIISEMKDEELIALEVLGGVLEQKK